MPSIAEILPKFELPGILDRPEIEADSGTSYSPEWKITVYDNSVNTYQQVIDILVLATSCTMEEAYIEAWEIDHYGKSDVHFSTESECQTAAQIIAQIGIKVEVLKND